MPKNELPEVIAFDGETCVGMGALPEVARAVKAHVQRHKAAQVLIFDGATSRPIELDLRGTLEQVLARLPKPAAPEEAPEENRGPGRPKLGVVAREVTLLPHHWEWLNAQPGGASVALRKLVEQARRDNADADRIREARESVYRFMVAVAGSAPRFEDGARALFAGEDEAFREVIKRWPKDPREHLRRLHAAVS